MFRFRRVVGAGALLLAVAGCTLTSFLMPSPGTSGPREIVAGSAEMVAARLQDGLTEAGITALRERDRSEIRLAGETKTGKAFCIHLSTRRVGGTDKTLVHVFWWQRDADPEFWRMVVDMLAAPTDSSGG